MSEAFGSDYLTIEDEDGNEFELEVLNEFELDGQDYLAALPADMDEDDPDFGIILLKIMEENGEELFGSIDDDDRAGQGVQLLYGRDLRRRGRRI